jgi:hypothetical protein
MFAPTRWTARGLLAAGAWLVIAALSLAVPAPERQNGTFKDRAAFIPYRRYQPLPGKAIGVLVADALEMTHQEGRYGPPDAFAFSAGGNSYRWMYVPVADKPFITNFRVPVGEKGDQFVTYPGASLATAQTAAHWGIKAPFALVEVEVNEGLGSPPVEGFVATKMKRLDGSEDFPLKLPEVVADLRRMYKRYLGEQQGAVTAALDKAEKDALKDRKPTETRSTSQMFYLTWLPEEQRLSVRFRTRITSGSFQEKRVPIPGNPRPFPLPPPPKGQGKAQAAVALPPTASTSAPAGFPTREGRPLGHHVRRRVRPGLRGGEERQDRPHPDAADRAVRPGGSSPARRRAQRRAAAAPCPAAGTEAAALSPAGGRSWPVQSVRNKMRRDALRRPFPSFLPNALMDTNVPCAVRPAELRTG